MLPPDATGNPGRFRRELDGDGARENLPRTGDHTAIQVPVPEEASNPRKIRMPPETIPERRPADEVHRRDDGERVDQVALLDCGRVACLQFPRNDGDTQVGGAASHGMRNPRRLTERRCRPGIGEGPPGRALRARIEPALLDAAACTQRNRQGSREVPAHDDADHPAVAREDAPRNERDPVGVGRADDHETAGEDPGVPVHAIEQVSLGELLWVGDLIEADHAHEIRTRDPGGRALQMTDAHG